MEAGWGERLLELEPAMTTDTKNRRPDPSRAWSAGSLFRCVDCNGNKHTQGRKLVTRRGIRAWVCKECVKPTDFEAKK